MNSIFRGATPVHGGSSTLHPNLPLKTSSGKCLCVSLPIPRQSVSRIRVYSSVNARADENPVLRTAKAATKTLILSAAAFALLIGRFQQLPARAEPSRAATEEKLQEQAEDEKSGAENETSPLSKFLESRSEAVDVLKSLLDQKLDAGEESEALKVLRQLVSAQPTNLDWKFLMARLLNEMGEVEESRKVFEEILAVDPLSFEALFQNALLMDRCGEGESVVQRLEEALRLAEEEAKEKEARDVRFIMAQIQYLQKNIDEALASYQQLAAEDPKDFRPYFCRGVIYSLLGRNDEAREQFAKYRELSPSNFDVEGYLMTPLSKMKLFGSDSEN